jgi:hypothetical protein
LALATNPAFPLLVSQRDSLTLGIVGAIMLLLDLACYTEASGQKSEGQGVAFGGFPLIFFDNNIGKYCRY